jgi:hypothetical protein
MSFRLSSNYLLAWLAITDGGGGASDSPSFASRLA